MATYAVGAGGVGVQIAFQRMCPLRPVPEPCSWEEAVMLPASKRLACLFNCRCATSLCAAGRREHKHWSFHVCKPCRGHFTGSSERGLRGCEGASTSNCLRRVAWLQGQRGRLNRGSPPGFGRLFCLLPSSLCAANHCEMAGKPGSVLTFNLRSSPSRSWRPHGVSIQ